MIDMYICKREQMISYLRLHLMGYFVSLSHKHPDLSKQSKFIARNSWNIIIELFSFTILSSLLSFSVLPGSQHLFCKKKICLLLCADALNVGYRCIYNICRNCMGFFPSFKYLAMLGKTYQDSGLLNICLFYLSIRYIACYLSVM